MELTEDVKRTTGSG